MILNVVLTMFMPWIVLLFTWLLGGDITLAAAAFCILFPMIALAIIGISYTEGRIDGRTEKPRGKNLGS